MNKTPTIFLSDRTSICDHRFRMPGQDCPDCGESEGAAQPDDAPDELAQAAPFKWDYERKIEELEAQLADLKDFAYNRAPKLAAAELQRQKEEYEAQLATARTERDTCAQSALKVLSSCFCDDHGEKVKRISFPDFCEWTKDMGCHACAFERAEKAEARLAAIDGALDDADAPDATEAHALDNDPIVERIKLWRHVDSEIQVQLATANQRAEDADFNSGQEIKARMALKAQLAEARAALEAVEYHQAYTLSCPWCFRVQELGHRDGCARQAALNPREGERGKE